MQKHLVVVLATALAAAGLSTARTHAEREIVVQPGDTMRSLSLRYYGDEDHVGAIAQHNKLASPDLIFAGLRLALPDLPADRSTADWTATIVDQATPIATPTAAISTMTTNAATAAVPPLPPAPGVTPGPALTLVMPVLESPASPDSAPDPSQFRAAAAGGDSAVSGPVIQSGMATWYGPEFTGSITACGETFDQWAYTAASNTLACGTVIVVTNEDSGASVTVRVTDRGGFGGSMILDLARGAFDVIAPESAGVCPVTVSLPAH